MFIQMHFKTSIQAAAVSIVHLNDTNPTLNNELLELKPLSTMGGWNIDDNNI